MKHILLKQNSHQGATSLPRRHFTAKKVMLSYLFQTLKAQISVFFIECTVFRDYHSFVANAENIICGYLWIFLAICGCKNAWYTLQYQIHTGTTLCRLSSAVHSNTSPPLYKTHTSVSFYQHARRSIGAK